MRPHVGLALLLVGMASCGGATSARDPGLPGDPCSELARAIYRWQGDEEVACGPGTTEDRELLAIGGGHVLEWVPTTGRHRVWSVGGSAPLGAGPLSTGLSTVRQGQILFPLADRRVIAADLLDTGWRIYSVDVGPEAGATANAIAPAVGQDVFSDPFWGHELVALDDGYVLKWWSGSGEYVVLHYDRENETLSGTTFRGTQEALRRGAQIVNLGAHRLLEWIPAKGSYRIWAYHFDAASESIFDPDPIYPEAMLEGVGSHDRILVVDRTEGAERILIWRRDDGALSLRALDPLGADPLGGESISEGTYSSLASPDWSAPATSRIQNVVVVLQRGRSFDSYFGQYCTGGAAASDCDEGPGCCEAMPGAIPGASSPATLDADADDHKPDDRTSCLVAKIAGGAMDGYATAAACGSPLDFSCAGSGPAAGAVGGYHRLADEGALADRFFQSTIDGDEASAELNLIYLSKAAYGIDVSTEGGHKQLTFLLSQKGVRYALYLDQPHEVTQKYGQLPPQFYDPHWTTFRSVDELDRDLDLGQLPAISIVVSPPGLDEQPGHGPAAAGIDFVTTLADKVAASPYRPTTLVLVGYLTSGGYYDHVSPPAPPPVSVDANGAGLPIPYGPRVPLLAVGPFARRGHVSHVQMELSSITAFLEWNWLGGAADQLGHRDAAVANIGSLLDAGETGVPVP